MLNIECRSFKSLFNIRHSLFDINFLNLTAPPQGGIFSCKINLQNTGGEIPTKAEHGQMLVRTLSV
jgi:hypothetical protein